MTASAPPIRKRIKLALQGGGAHGAFTWGVLDRLLGDPRLEVEGIVGTSAGAMNTALVADGLAAGGPDLARRILGEFWQGVGKIAAAAPVQPSPMDRLSSPGTMRFSPLWLATDAMLKLFSPYQLNPLNQNPLRQLLEELVDFPRLRAAEKPAAFICATNVLNGRLRVFARHEMSAAAVMASGCLPQLFQAVEVDGEHYWDGGYSGNPPIFPLIYMGGCPDIIIVQLNPINIPAVPRDMRAIMDRINTLAFNSSLMREMRMIHFVTQLIDRGDLDGDKYLRLFIHCIDAEDQLAGLDPSSKLNQGELVKLQDWLQHHRKKVVVLFEGRDSAGKGGVIKRIMQRMNPRICRVVALPAPSDREKTQWYFQRYVSHLPAGGEMVLFDRSWYNRAGVERVMGFAGPDQVEEFFRDVPEFERMLVRSGVILVKYWFSITDQEQQLRFLMRIHDPIKQWKLSPMDLQSRVRWEQYTKAKEDMFERTNIPEAPWHIVEGNDKKRARLNCISHLLSLIPYEAIAHEPITLPERIFDPNYERRTLPADLYVPDSY